MATAKWVPKIATPPSWTGRLPLSLSRPQHHPVWGWTNGQESAGSRAGASGVDPRRKAAPRVEGSRRREAEGGGGVGVRGDAGRLSDWLRRRPLQLRGPYRAPGNSLPRLPSGVPQKRRTRRGGTDLRARTRLRARGDKTPAAGAGTSGPGASRERRGGAGPTRRPRPRLLDAAAGAGRPARGHRVARAPRRYLQRCNEKSPGEPSGARREDCCARGCCCRRGCLKLPKLTHSERLPPAGSKRERISEGARDGQTDTQTFRKHRRRRRSISATREASQLCELFF